MDADQQEENGANVVGNSSFAIAKNSSIKKRRSSTNQTSFAYFVGWEEKVKVVDTHIVKGSNAFAAPVEETDNNSMQDSSALDYCRDCSDRCLNTFYQRLNEYSIFAEYLALLSPSQLSSLASITINVSLPTHTPLGKLLGNLAGMDLWCCVYFSVCLIGLIFIFGAYYTTGIFKLMHSVQMDGSGMTTNRVCSYGDHSMKGHINIQIYTLLPLR
ncbi:hypothetical protein EGR_10328 [Echinococcus granulosus]|uniref:Uncharacterized protein n=1 Tax=Echinococcus granulosus TaxID=6210 RepID=W6U2N8_ECHGR|nr:hypothetical protein EGR_10328 [Echinococcus granulosus]EUB54821.1 hypothetical protein EGR_10328 [Echinococcus granulosus]